MKSKNFQRDRAQAAALLEWAQQSEQAELQAAWDELQSVPSYCEQQAAAFAQEQEDSIS